MKLVLLAVLIAVLAGLGWGTKRVIEVASAEPVNTIPVTQVRKGTVSISVSARGELQGGNSEVLTAPMVGGGDLYITSLREPGQLVNAGDTVVEFDTTQQEFNLREAEADLAEAEQQVKKAEAEQRAADIEAALQIQKTSGDVELAELDVRKNSLISAVAARQNEIALEAARNRQR